MEKKLTSKQVTIIVLVPIGVLAFSALLYHWFGNVALIVPPVLIGIFLAYLLVESRHYQLGLFVRSLEESRAQYLQIESILGLTWAIDPLIPLPSTRGWAASPDLLRAVYGHVLEEQPQLVVEASSGTSTIVIAYALKRLGNGNVIALEHEAEYAERTRQNIAAHGLSDHATVVLAPLVMQECKGETYEWYDLSKLQLPGTIDLLLVDGPPDTIRPMARYPAVPLLAEYFSAKIGVFLDDGGREDERRTAEQWASEFNAHSSEYLYLEKGGWLLRFHK
ncbi:MAG: class I SAM-dependent methyltransferase [Flavobacteriales bacterium]|nr:class I SAM-dependent methyltransferase [Flavobacteriales bacterium]